jgi:hypothetical protein
LADICLAILYYYISKSFYLYKVGGNKCINIRYLLAATIYARDIKALIFSGLYFTLYKPLNLVYKVFTSKAFKYLV